MSSNTSGGIASTTLVCSLGMSVVDKASAKFKGNKRSLAKQSQVTSNCGLVLALAMRYLARLQLVSALYTISMFSRAAAVICFPALNTNYMCSRALCQLHIFPALKKSRNLDCNVY